MDQTIDEIINNLDISKMYNGNAYGCDHIKDTTIYNFQKVFRSLGFVMMSGHSSE